MPNVARPSRGELGTGKSRLEVLANLGLKHITLAPLHRIEDGINAVRMLIPRCWFDQAKCARGLDALKLYRADYDDKLQALRPHPVHGPRTRRTRSAISP
jgi:phage terminase large subunit